LCLSNCTIFRLLPVSSVDFQLYPPRSPLCGFFFSSQMFFSMPISLWWRSIASQHRCPSMVFSCFRTHIFFVYQVPPLFTPFPLEMRNDSCRQYNIRSHAVVAVLPLFPRNQGPGCGLDPLPRLPPFFPLYIIPVLQVVSEERHLFSPATLLYSSTWSYFHPPRLEDPFVHFRLVFLAILPPLPVPFFTLFPLVSFLPPHVSPFPTVTECLVFLYPLS